MFIVEYYEYSVCLSWSIISTQYVYHGILLVPSMFIVEVSSVLSMFYFKKIKKVKETKFNNPNLRFTDSDYPFGIFKLFWENI